MTENEAIKVLVTQKQCIDKSSSGQCKINCRDCKKNIPIVYQEKSYEVAISALEEIQQYREIGTVEECREAVEKQKAKKCVQDTCPDHMHYKCPTCGKIQMSECKRGIRILGRITNFCDNCGQGLESEK